MALVWIVTTGNSDVAMASAKDWKDLKTKKNLPLIYNKLPISELSNNKKQEKLFFLPARALGNLYGDVLDDEKYSKTLRFALLQGFVDKLKDKNKKPDRIIILLTDQAAIFGVSDRNSIDSPYWKDTCTLEPILERYLRQEFNSAKIEFAILQPKAGENGLDDWDSTLKLVQNEFVKWNISKGDRVIVSHQAGTPAISSAVQLTSLIRFGKKVDFLVSNELNLVDGTKFLKGSSYFDTLQIKKLEDLLARDDYAGVASVVKSMELEDSDNKTRLEHLLELAKLWNAAKFDEFATKMGGDATRRSQEWWWKGYEMAYLAIARMKNGDPTEALFHSVRAIEGLICEWAIHKENRSDLYGQSLYDLFKLKRGDCNDLPIKVVWSNLAFVRNDLFHTLRGITSEEVWNAWDESSKNGWENRMFICLNFVTEQARTQEFKSLKSASLMARVHEELVKEIGAIAK